MKLPLGLQISSEKLDSIRADANKGAFDTNWLQEIAADYMAIVELWEMTRDGKMTKDEFFTAIDEMICF
jgi:hypothetical protein